MNVTVCNGNGYRFIKHLASHNALYTKWHHPLGIRSTLLTIPSSVTIYNHSKNTFTVKKDVVQQLQVTSCNRNCNWRSDIWCGQEHGYAYSDLMHLFLPQFLNEVTYGSFCTKSTWVWHHLLIFFVIWPILKHLWRNYATPNFGLFHQLPLKLWSSKSWFNNWSWFIITCQNILVQNLVQNIMLQFILLNSMLIYLSDDI